MTATHPIPVGTHIAFDIEDLIVGTAIRGRDSRIFLTSLGPLTLPLPRFFR